MINSNKRHVAGVQKKSKNTTKMLLKFKFNWSERKNVNKKNNKTAKLQKGRR